MAPYTQLLKVHRGRATFQPQHSSPSPSPSPNLNQLVAESAGVPSHSALAASSAGPVASTASPRVLVDVQLPGGAGVSVVECRVVLLVPQLDGQSYPELLSLLTHLQGCGCDLAALTVCCLTAARPALWAVMSVYPALALIATAVDEQRHQQLVPGVRQLDSRSAATMVHGMHEQRSEHLEGQAESTGQSETAQQAVSSVQDAVRL